MKDIVSITFHTAPEEENPDGATLMYEWFGNARGLVGSTGNNREMLARDGATVMDDINAFGQEWQVRNRYVESI